MFDNFKVLSFNCQKGYPGNTAAVINNWLREGTYDLFLLQEASTKLTENLQLAQTGYKIFSIFNPEVGVISQLCFVYKDKFFLEEHAFFPLVKFRPQNSWRAEFGLLLGTFKYGDSRFVAASVHLTPGFQFIVRKRELLFVRDCISQYNSQNLPTILGGDFNSLVFGEIQRNANILALHFVNVTLDTGPTSQTRYMEPDFAINRFALWLAKFGINFKGKVDHIYIDNDSAKSHITQSRILPERASDHSPLELTFKLSTANFMREEKRVNK